MKESGKTTAPAFYAWPAPAGAAAPLVSVVAPMLNEAGVAGALVREVAAALGDFEHEIVIVDDGSSDGTGDALAAEKKEIPQLRVIRHGAAAGQSRAIRSGVLAARGAIIAMIDGDGQNDPKDIADLIARLRAADAGVAMVAGERVARADTSAKALASRIANSVRKRLLKDAANDTGCGLKVFYREAYLRLPYFDHMHRYFPALMAREGFGVAFAPVSDRPRRHGASKYSNFGRLLVAIRDLAGVLWLLGRFRDPKSIEERLD
ncbi:MAG: glycosyltransferase family 2 protein [Pseudomonadota bacterium]